MRILYYISQGLTAFVIMGIAALLFRFLLSFLGVDPTYQY